LQEYDLRRRQIESSHSRTNSAQSAAFLIAVEIPKADSLWDTPDPLDELAALARTAGGSRRQRCSALSRPNSALYVGRDGARTSWRRYAPRIDLDLLIVDDELSPTQQRNLEERPICA
jgi:GTP-binding protein HflX